MKVHFHPNTGEIVLWDTSRFRDYHPRIRNAIAAGKMRHSPSHLDGHLVCNVEAAAIDPKRQRIDLQTFDLADKSAAEIAAGSMPDELDVRHAISSELHHSDGYTAPDRPLREDVRAGWLAYRAALRALSKLPGPVEMVRAWPARPDSVDPIQHLRQRVS
jgi:hypothetical protein